VHIYVFPKDYRSLLEILPKIYGLNTKNLKNELLNHFLQILAISTKSSEKCGNELEMANSGEKNQITKRMKNHAQQLCTSSYEPLVFLCFLLSHRKWKITDKNCFWLMLSYTTSHFCLG